MHPRLDNQTKIRMKCSFSKSSGGHIPCRLQHLSTPTNLGVGDNDIDGMRLAHSVLRFVFVIGPLTMWVW